MSALPQRMNCLPNSRRQFAFRDGGIELARRQRRPLQRPVLPVQLQRPLHFLVRIETGVDGA